MESMCMPNLHFYQILYLRIIIININMQTEHYKWEPIGALGGRHAHIYRVHRKFKNHTISIRLRKCLAKSAK